MKLSKSQLNPVLTRFRYALAAVGVRLRRSSAEQYLARAFGQSTWQGCVFQEGLQLPPLVVMASRIHAQLEHRNLLRPLPEDPDRQQWLLQHVLSEALDVPLVRLSTWFHTIRKGTQYLPRERSFEQWLEDAIAWQWQQGIAILAPSPVTEELLTGMAIAAISPTLAVSSSLGQLSELEGIPGMAAEYLLSKGISAQRRVAEGLKDLEFHTWVTEGWLKEHCGEFLAKGAEVDEVEFLAKIRVRRLAKMTPSVSGDPDAMAGIRRCGVCHDFMVGAKGGTGPVKMICATCSIRSAYRTTSEPVRVIELSWPGLPEGMDRKELNAVISGQVLEFEEGERVVARVATSLHTLAYRRLLNLEFGPGMVKGLEIRLLHLQEGSVRISDVDPEGVSASATW
ncbi:hypothetical protein [Ferrimonas marina]|uniref:hypothetical protein n=1 Tax=Ferrimonas marina TaxID=299255 RepID=UPI00082F2E2F|nr:hypothetical protein [Ferrimonas marina]